MNLVRDLFFVHALAHELEVWTSATADACRAVAMRAAMLCEEFCAALLCA
jgi:hypothetical protein